MHNRGDSKSEIGNSNFTFMFKKTKTYFVKNNENGNSSALRDNRDVRTTLQ